MTYRIPSDVINNADAYKVADAIIDEIMEKTGELQLWNQCTPKLPGYMRSFLHQVSSKTQNFSKKLKGHHSSSVQTGKPQLCDDRLSEADAAKKCGTVGAPVPIFQS